MSVSAIVYRRLSVCLSVRHALALYQNGDTQNREIFTEGFLIDSSILVTKFHGDG